MKSDQEWQQELDEARRDAEVWRGAAMANAAREKARADRAEGKLHALVTAMREWAQMFDDTDDDYAWHYAEHGLRSAIAAAKDDFPP